MKKQYWLFKSEPTAYSIDDMKKDKVTYWDGVRNYQARNNMQSMQKGDLALFHHSNANPPGIAGFVEICKEAYPDDTAWDPKSRYCFKKSSPENPIWYRVDVKFVAKFPEVLALGDLKENRKLEGMVLLSKGSRLSVQPVEKKYFEVIRKLGLKK
ncbi:MAG: EVE domain-containing protein [Candidatus Lindowbacteria bacterium]|nr:EVE domain-containing protein [Candidatus Lindowbacteria bacterium]